MKIRNRGKINMRQRKPRRESYSRYLVGEDDPKYLDAQEVRGIELLAKQFRVRMLGRVGNEVARETITAAMETERERHPDA